MREALTPRKHKATSFLHKDESLIFKEIRFEMPSLKALVLIVVVVATSLVWFLNSDVTVQSSKGVAISTTEPKQTNTSAQETVNTADKEQKQSESQKTTSNVNNPVASPTSLGVDPFKEFLDKQKQNSKDQVVSPFGKN